MRSKWFEEKENLENMILVLKLSYEEIGRQYGCSGSNIKKVALRIGIELPLRRKINDCETFNRGKKKVVTCLNCGKTISSGRSNRKYCCVECLKEYEYNQRIIKWKSGDLSGGKGVGQTCTFVRKYLMRKYNNSCQKCGWHEVNPYTGLVPLLIHHIDGDCTNSKEENLQLLCPNCHSLTENFGILNKNSKRFHRLKATLQDGVISSSELNT